MGHTGHFDAYRYIHIWSVFVCLYVGAGALGRNDPPLQFGPILSCLNPPCPPPPPREDSPPPPPSPRGTVAKVPPQPPVNLTTTRKRALQKPFRAAVDSCLLLCPSSG